MLDGSEPEEVAVRCASTVPWRARVRELPRDAYPENESVPADDELPVFMTVLHAHLAEGAARKTEVELLTLTLATALDIAPTRVRSQYAAAGAGRQASGGQLVK